MTWTEAQAVHDARERLALMLEFAQALGMTMKGEVYELGPAGSVTRAIADHGPFDGVVVVDHPHGLGRLFERRLLVSIEAAAGLPLQHLHADPPMHGGHLDVAAARSLFEAALAELRR
ncbi:MAG: hypothetical protein M3203_07190 [Actinomycetota bacterium]|nr:hypothetical protein [Actinomycetota bacterium]